MTSVSFLSVLQLFLLALQVFLLVFLGTNALDVVDAKKETVFRWASCGGGWRAMFTDVGFANALHRAGVSFDNTKKNKDIPTITGLSSTSGGTWFGTQFFYSPDFYASVLTDDANELYNFVITWMVSYMELTESILASDASACNVDAFNQFGGDYPVDNLVEDDAESPLPGEPKQWCILIRHYRGDWAAFVTDMLTNAARMYERQGTAAIAKTPFSDRIAGPDERNPPLQKTDLIVQTSLSPMARVTQPRCMHVYLGPDLPDWDGVSLNPDSQYFATMLPTAYTVSSVAGQPGFRIGNWTPQDLVTHSDFDPQTFNVDDYAMYHLYQGPNDSSSNADPRRTIFTEGPPTTGGMGTLSPWGKFQTPFATTRSIPSTGQIASMSSAAMGSLSGLNPSELAQFLSTKFYKITSNASLTLVESKAQQAVLEQASDWLYDAADLWGVSVCTQWPRTCEPTDSRFSDGAYTDNPALPMNLAQYQRDFPDTLGSTVLKFVSINPNGVTPTNNYTTYNDGIYLGYFNTTFNQGVEPGGFVWAPGQPVPWPSTQIFQEYLDAASFHAKFETVAGTNWTTAVLKGTTIDNPVYGVRAGQSVEILYFMINSYIPSRLIGTDDIAAYTEPLADLAKEIATNQDLQSKIRDFFYETDDTSSSSSVSSHFLWMVTFLVVTVTTASVSFLF